MRLYLGMSGGSWFDRFGEHVGISRALQVATSVGGLKCSQDKIRVVLIREAEYRDPSLKELGVAWHRQSWLEVLTIVARTDGDEGKR